MKTKKAVAARFRLTATGQLKASQPGKRHILTGKPNKLKRQKRRPFLLDASYLKKYKMLMCV